MATKYNPYNAVKNISELKGNYHTAKELGGDYKQYQLDAVKYYNELADNGYSDVADELTMSDYTKSLDILRRFKPDEEFGVDAIYNGIVNSAADIAGGKTVPKTSDAVQKILDSFGRTDDLLNGKITTDANGNVTGGLNIDHYNEGKSQLDRINNFDYTKESYFDPIMSTYKLKGEDAAKGALAGGASSNGGNIDSYAAANANRQQLAFTNAGHEAARAAAQQNHDNWQKLYDSMGGHLTEMGAINSENLGTAANMHATDSAERQNAMKTAAGLADSEAVRRAEAYLAKLADDTTRYGIDAEVGMNTANNQAVLQQLGRQLAAEKYIAQIDNDAEMDRLLKTIEAEGAMNDADNRTEIEKILMQMQGAGETVGTETEDSENNLLNVANFVQTAIDDIGNGNGINNLYDVRQAAIEMFGTDEKVIGWIDEVMQNYVKYAGKGKNGLVIGGETGDLLTPVVGQ